MGIGIYIEELKMIYEIKGQETKDEPKLKLGFEMGEDGSVTIFGTDKYGAIWYLLKLRPNGTFYRCKNIPPSVGLQVNANGQIMDII